jgi:diguanylate cyclase
MSDFVKARKNIERAVMLLERYGVAPTPTNLMAWYAYAADIDPSWSRKLEQFLASRDTLSSERRDEIICHFVMSQLECRKLFQGVNGVYAAVSNVLGHLAKAEGESTEFGRAIKATAERLEGAGSPDDMRAAASEIVDLAERMADRQAELSRTLKETSEEVFLLRNRLEEVHRQAVTDDLTDLGNRRYFDAKLREMVEEAVQVGNDLSLVLIDIDHFKQFNDKHGHPVGDNVLKLVAGIIKSATRATDVAARIGGEEFGLILRRAAAKEAVALAERIRKTLESRELVKRGAQESLGRITVSAGVAPCVAGISVDDLFARADEALYTAKREGRNRVITYRGGGEGAGS